VVVCQKLHLFELLENENNFECSVNQRLFGSELFVGVKMVDVVVVVGATNNYLDLELVFFYRIRNLHYKLGVVMAKMGIVVSSMELIVVEFDFVASFLINYF
jgi:hypothetical protein